LQTLSQVILGHFYELQNIAIDVSKNAGVTDEGAIALCKTFSDRERFVKL
jgi:hypothetical protein